MAISKKFLDMLYWQKHELEKEIGDIQAEPRPLHRNKLKNSRDDGYYEAQEIGLKSSLKIINDLIRAYIGDY